MKVVRAAMQVLESNQRLSESILWKLQHAAYQQYGIDAWHKYGVPSYITSNTYIAKGYAQVVLGYLRDGLAKALFNVADPIYLIDLGAGTGRFAYFFLRELLPLLESSSLPKLKLCYVLTDIVPSNLTYWQQHAYLKPYFEQGVLDCALYHHAQTEYLQLLYRPQTLTPSALANPPILIANYFFDTIPQDLFRVKDGCLEEGQITLLAHSPETREAGPEVINKLKAHYSYTKISQPKKYYIQPELNAFLTAYVQEFEDCTFLLPIGAFQVLNTFIKWSPKGFLFLAGDRGVCTAKQVREWGEPQLALHGSFSFPVNFHAIAAFLQNKIALSTASPTKAALALFTDFAEPAFAVMVGGLSNQASADFSETKLAFKTHLNHFEPFDYFKIVSLTDELWKEAPIDHMLLLIKLGNWDASVLLDFYTSLRDKILTANEKQKQMLCDMIEKVWEHFFPIEPSTGDFILNLGVMLFDLQRYELAKLFFERSVLITGPNAAALKNIASCHQVLGDIEQAKKYRLQADALDG